MMGFALVAVAAAGCVTLHVGSDDASPPRFAYAVPPAPWTRVTSPMIGGKATTASFRSAATGAVLGVASTCDHASDESSEALLATVTGVVAERRVIAPHVAVPDAKMPSAGARVAGTFDGKNVELLALVLRSPRCVYDVVTSAPQLAPADTAAALAVAASLHETPR